MCLGSINYRLVREVVEKITVNEENLIIKFKYEIETDVRFKGVESANQRYRGTLI